MDRCTRPIVAIAHRRKNQARRNKPVRRRTTPCPRLLRPNQNDACCAERPVLLCLREHEDILPRLELVTSGGQSGHAYITWNTDGLHATAVLNGECRCTGPGADRSIGHARRRTRDGAIGHPTATRTLCWIRIHQVAPSPMPRSSSGKMLILVAR